MEITRELWGNYEGLDIYLFTLKTANIEVKLSNFGAIITAILMPGATGQAQNIVLGYPTLQEYINDTYYVGCTVGRMAGRIANARFQIDGSTYTLTKNEGNDSLHGGSKGFNKRVFDVAGEQYHNDAASVTLHYRSPHMEEGYPGNLDVWITYQLSADNSFTISYKAVSDADTHVNLTNHSYFNLSETSCSALNHQLFINADNLIVTDKAFIPTGDLAGVIGTPYDFKTPHTIANHRQHYKNVNYNECYVLNKTNGTPDAVLKDEQGKRKLSFETDMPGILFYSGDYLGGSFCPGQGLCLETQYFPDTPNHPGFPSTLLKAGEEWNSYTKLSFEW